MLAISYIDFRTIPLGSNILEDWDADLCLPAPPGMDICGHVQVPGVSLATGLIGPTVGA